MSSVPRGLRARFSVSYNSFQAVQIIHKGSFLDAENDVPELTIESRVPIEVPSCKNKLQIGSDWMVDIELDSLRLAAVAILDETDSSLQRHAVTVIDIGP